ncbi:MAG: FAD:protein FMN transferase [Patescibacteria group bacterium]
MPHLQFPALGTEWTIVIDDPESADTAEKTSTLQAEILAATEAFDQECSRFIQSSQACAFRDQPAGTYTVSQRFAQLLQTAQQLKISTKGAYDPAVGGLLELLGYDANYSFRAQSQAAADFSLPEWSIEGDQLQISGGVIFDIGGIGKGYWIDEIADMVEAAGFKQYLVDGGGDMFGTTKSDGTGWKIALEWPGDAQRVIGVVELQNQGLAVSDVFKRRWDEWHHLVSIKTKKPTQEIIWSAAVADSAWQADQATAALALDWPRAQRMVSSELAAQFLACTFDKKVHRSPDWSGEVF